MSNEITEITENKPVLRKTYLPTFNFIRLICLIFIILTTFPVPIPYFDLIQPLFYFSSGVLFTLYGFSVLRDGTDLRKNIKHSLKVFLILFAVYFALTLIFYWLSTGNPFYFYSKRNIFNFIVLDNWFCGIGSSIWFVQATLYSLIAFWILRKYKKYDWILCIALFVVAILVGEFAKFTGFPYFGYNYIPGNFFTRAMPYMLLGRLIHNHFDKIPKFFVKKPFILLIIGIVLSITEYVLLALFSQLTYVYHMIGFIPISASLCIYGASNTPGEIVKFYDKFATPLYKYVYFTFNPIGYILASIFSIFCATQTQFNKYQSALGVFVILLSFGSYLTYYIVKKIITMYNED